MTRPEESEIDRLRAPSESGETLVYPRPGEILSLVEKNRRRFPRSIRLLQRPLDEWLPSPAGGPPTIMAGHQPEFFHPGVWAKNVFAAALAGRMGGRCDFLVVDGDVPRRMGFAVPVPEGGLSIAVSVLDDPVAGRSYEQWPLIPDTGWSALFEPARRMQHIDRSLLPAFADAFCGCQDEYVRRWIAGVRAVDQSLDLRPLNMERVSVMFGNGAHRLHRAASAFIAHLMLSAEAFASAYNQSLVEYRRRRGMRDVRRPMPDLATADGATELPFWALRSDQPRRRLFVRPSPAGGLTVLVGGERMLDLSTNELAADPQSALSPLLTLCGLRPRALSQTLFVRLAACDLFVHGIGGAKYDQITDAIIRRFWGAEPPGYACVSATLHLPLSRHPVAADDLRAARRRLRDLHCNPQRHLPDRQTGHESRSIAADRWAAAAESMRLRQEFRDDRASRREAFLRIQEINRRLREMCTMQRAEAGEAVARIARQLAENRVALDREWFYAIYPRTDLEALRDKILSEVR